MAVSLVFQGENIEEVDAAVLKYVSRGQPTMVVDLDTPEPEKKTPAKKKKVAAKKKIGVHDKVPDDPMDLFGDDEPAGDGEADLIEEDDPFGATDPTIEDVKNALGAVVSAWDEKNNTGAEKAKKILQVYGDADDLGTLDKSLYRKIITNSDLVAEKANG